jgi:tetratricopeptide (TPR) repeat protein
MNKAEKMYIQALEIRERLAQRDSLRFGPDLALTASRLGAFYFNLQKLPESEKMLSLALTMWEHLAQNDPVTFEPELAKTGLILGDVLLYLQKLPESEKTLLHALEIQDRLAQKDPIQFGPTLARTQNDLGFLYHQSGNMPESERRLMRALEIYEHMAQSDPAQFEPELAGTALNLSALRMQNGQLEDAAALGSRALALRKKALVARQTNSWDEFNRAYTFTAALRDSLATHRSYPAAVALQQMRAECTDTLWELDIKILSKAAGDFGNLSWQYLFNGQYAQAEQAAKKALELDDSQHWVKTNLGHSYLLRGNLKKAKQVYREYMDDDGPKAKSMLLKDLDALEAGGVKHGDIGKVRKWLEGL